MWNKRDKINRDKTTPNKLIVYVSVVFAILLGVALFAGCMCAIIPALNTYFHETKEISNLYDFYDLKVGQNSTAVYFVGASHIGDAVFPEEIHRILDERGYGNITVYNLYVSGQSPLDCAIQLQKVIDTHPVLVVYGLSNALMGAEGIIEDNVLIVQNRLKIRDDSLYLYTDSEQEILTGGVDLWKMKRFIRGAVTAFFTEGVRSYTQTYDYATDPIGNAETRIAKTNFRKAGVDLSYLEDIDEINYSVSNRSIDALTYIKKTLDKEEIASAVVSVPLNPLSSDKVTNTSRDEYTKALTDIYDDWYDLEYALTPEEFVDTTHVTFDGAMKLAPLWADIIIQELT